MQRCSKNRLALCSKIDRHYLGPLAAPKLCFSLHTRHATRNTLCYVRNMVTDLTIVRHGPALMPCTDDGADTDSGDPLAHTETRRVVRDNSSSLMQAASQRFFVGAMYNVGVSLLASFRKRNAQPCDYKYMTAKLTAVRDACEETHAHSEDCYKTLCMQFCHNDSWLWIDPKRYPCKLIV